MEKKLLIGLVVEVVSRERERRRGSGGIGGEMAAVTHSPKERNRRNGQSGEKEDLLHPLVIPFCGLGVMT